MTSILSGSVSTNRRMSRFELSDTVRIARGAAGRHRNRGARVAKRQAVRQVLREHQVDAVVDRDDRSARHERRQHIVRRVEERHAFAPERERNLASARRSSSCPPIRRPRRKFSPSVISAAHILGTAEQDVLGLLVQTRQVPKQIADVGADAEIVKFPGIDADSHAVMIAGRARRPASTARDFTGSRDRSRTGEVGTSLRCGQPWP